MPPKNIKNGLEEDRLNAALQSVSTNIMMCDTDLNINYVNAAAASLFSSIPNAMRKRFPGCDPNNMMGHNIDQFHTEPRLSTRHAARPVAPAHDRPD